MAYQSQGVLYQSQIQIYRKGQAVDKHMSNKNLKVYRIQFITELKQMHFKVKFPCKVKAIWKRSNQSAQSTACPVENGIVHFNQTLKMYVNMYFDTTNNRFVEKKCLFSFHILAEKGQKTAGSVTYDLSQFFNRRIYEVEQSFSLDKCPIAETKIHMKIYYEQSTQTGYDSMSRISTSSQLDTSAMSMDASEFGEQGSKEGTGVTGEETGSSKSMSQSDLGSKGQKDKDEETESNYDLLDESDLGGNVRVEGQGEGQEGKISENIQAMNKITGKINEFVSRCSGNIKKQLENLKLTNKKLEQNLSVVKFQNQKLETLSQHKTQQIDTLKKQLNQAKISFESQTKKQQNRYNQILEKYQQSQKLCHQLQKNMQEKGQSQSSYITDLKNNFKQSEAKYKGQIDQLGHELSQEKKEKSELIEKVTKMQGSVKELKEKLAQAQEKNTMHEAKQRQREKQLSDLRYKLENVYEQIVKSIGALVQQ